MHLGPRSRVKKALAVMSDSDNVELTEQELQYAQGEGIAPAEILRIKREWHLALAMVLERLESPQGVLNGEIGYYPAKWYESHSLVAVYYGDQYFPDGYMSFSVPNAETPYEIYLSLEAKVGAAAHEKFGHMADFQQMAEAGGDIIPAYRWAEWPSREQRTNLRTAFLFPKELHRAIDETLRSFVRWFSLPAFESESSFKALVTLEVLGLAGLPRRGDLPLFYRELDRATKGKVRRWCLYTTYSLTNSLQFRQERLRTTELREALAAYLESHRAEDLDIFSSPRFRPDGDVESCLSTVDLRWIDLGRAQKEMDEALVEARAFRKGEENEAFRWVYEDWVKALEAMSGIVVQSSQG